MGLYNGPDEVGNARHRDEVGLDREQVPDLVNGKPEGRQAACPKKKERNIVPGIGPGAGGHAVRKVGIAWPDSSNHECDA